MRKDEITLKTYFDLMLWGHIGMRKMCSIVWNRINLLKVIKFLNRDLKRIFRKWFKLKTNEQ